MFRETTWYVAFDTKESTSSSSASTLGYGFGIPSKPVTESRHAGTTDALLGVRCKVPSSLTKYPLLSKIVDTLPKSAYVPTRCVNTSDNKQRIMSRSIQMTGQGLQIVTSCNSPLPVGSDQKCKMQSRILCLR